MQALLDPRHSQKSKVLHTGSWRTISRSTAYTPIQPYIQCAAFNNAARRSP